MTATQHEAWHAVAQIEQSALGLGLLIGEITAEVNAPTRSGDLAARIKELAEEYMAFQVLLRRYLAVIKGLAA